MITLFLNKTLETIKKSREFSRLLKKFTEKDFPIAAGGLRGAVLAAVASELF
jgi:hypothetical protein